MHICVIGLGYIGLPTAAMFAGAGAQVTGVDQNPAIVDALNRGEILIEEPGLAELIRQVTADGRLTAQTAPVPADAFIIAVPTPITETKQADLSYVEAATSAILPCLQKGNLIVLESTSPVGTVDRLIAPLLAQSGLNPETDLFVGHSPERVIPGQILRELVQNDRIAGGLTAAAAPTITDLYRLFVNGAILPTDARTAELCQLADNTYRDVNIAFANELALICENFNINVWEAISLCNRHPRVNIHQPGPGVGGHCIAVDPWFIIEKQPELAQIITRSRHQNDAMPAHVAAAISRLVSGLTQPVVTILGITYKPDVDDLRESPILHMVELIKEKGITVKLCDPHATGRSDTVGLPITADPLIAAQGSDLLVLGVNHSTFRALDPAALGAVMRTRSVYDTRAFLPLADFARAGFQTALLGAPVQA